MTSSSKRSHQPSWLPTIMVLSLSLPSWLSLFVSLTHTHAHTLHACLLFVSWVFLSVLITKFNCFSWVIDVCWFKYYWLLINALTLMNYIILYRAEFCYYLHICFVVTAGCDGQCSDYFLHCSFYIEYLANIYVQSEHFFRDCNKRAAFNTTHLIRQIKNKHPRNTTSSL